MVAGRSWVWVSERHTVRSCSVNAWSGYAVISGLLLEAWLGARVGRGRQGRPLSSYQRLRVALNYTLGIGIVQAIVIAFVPIPGLERFTGSRGSFVFAITTVLWLAASGLLRYLLLSLFSSASARPRREVRA